MQYFGIQGYGYTSMRLQYIGPQTQIQLPRDPLQASNLLIRIDGQDLAVSSYTVNGELLNFNNPVANDKVIEIYYLDYEAPISMEVLNKVNEIWNTFEQFSSVLIQVNEALRNIEIWKDESKVSADEAAASAQEARDIIANGIGEVLRPFNNLSDLPNKAQSRINLGLGELATKNMSDIDMSQKMNKINALGKTNINTLGGQDKQDIYYQDANAEALISRGYPIQEAGSLFVTNSAYGCQQMYITFSSKRIFLRGLSAFWNNSNGPWLSWTEINHWINITDKPSVVTLNELRVGTSTAEKTITSKVMNDWLNSKSISRRAAPTEFAGVATSGGGSADITWTTDLPSTWVMTGVRTVHSRGSDYFTLYPRGVQLRLA